jgi:hypothetical protein
MGARCRRLLLGACLVWLAIPPSGVLGRSKKAKKSHGGGSGDSKSFSSSAFTWKAWAKDFGQRLAADVGRGAAGRGSAYAELGCTIDRHTPHTLSEKEFLSDYHL